MLSITLRLLGVDRMLDAEGGIDFQFSAYHGRGDRFWWFADFACHVQVERKAHDRRGGDRAASDPTERWLVDTVRRQAELVGIGMPEVAIYDAPDVNAFATGMNRNDALVAVSTGLLQNMRKDEIEGVLAHEISHVANGDMVTLALIQGVVNTFVIFLSRIIGHFVDRVVFKTERDHGPAFMITSLIAQMVLGILASMIVMWFSRQREFRADAGGAQLAGRNKMIAALERLKQRHEPSQLPEQTGGVWHFGRGGWPKVIYVASAA